MRSLILIPTSRFVSHEMQLEVGRIPPALIPLAGKTLLQLIVEQYKDMAGENTFALVVHEGQELVRAHLERVGLAGTVMVLEIPLVDSLGEAISLALHQIDAAAYDSLILHFADTLVYADWEGGKDTILYEDLEESYRWTTFEVQDGRITAVVDKHRVEYAEAHPVFVGWFMCKDPRRFAAAFDECRRDEEKDLFYSALLQYLAEAEYELVKVKRWLDFGHVDNYYQAKKLFINTRFFNQLEIDERRAVVKKTSANGQKLIGEIRWYLELPAALRCYIPQVFDYSLGPEQVFVAMEYYGYPTLGDLYLHAGHGLGIWHHVFESLLNILGELRAYQLHDDPRRIRQALHEVYVSKTLSRLEALQGETLFSEFLSEDLVINGTPYGSVRHYCAQLEALVSELLLADVAPLSIIHGDLCLANILFDPRSRVTKLLDPRGKFGSYSLYGDYRYDLAKLSHSFNGHYESIINDEFFLILEPGRIEYSLSLRPEQHIVTAMFNKRLEREYAKDLEAIALIEALLFLSMVPLHNDFPNRQAIMLATGIEKIDRVLQSRRAAQPRSLGRRS